MPTIEELDALNAEMTQWRRALHQKPEIAFEEEWTSDFIAEKLESFGIEIHRGLAETGIVGVVRGKVAGDRAAVFSDWKSWEQFVQSLPQAKLNFMMKTRFL
jgi:hippurate hydrolase